MIMFETNTVDGFSASQEQQAFGSQSTFADSPIAYGMQSKQENLIASSFSDIQDMGIDNQVGFFSGFPSFSWPTFSSIATSSDIGATSEEINEVNDLLDQDIYDRDQVTGDRNYTNYTTWWSSSSSANERSGYDRTDSMSQAVDIGEIVYRSDANVDGRIGYGSKWWGGIDRNDFFKFSVGKEGTIDLTLSGLSNDIGLALYSNSGSLLDWSDNSGTSNESIEQDLDVGNYYARIYSYSSYPWNHGATSYDLNISRQADALETSWEAMLTDSSLKNAALNSIKYDNELSRNDVIGILKSTGDYGKVTSTEFNNLQTFYNDAINTDVASEHVQVLAEKVLFDETSNQWYTGSDSEVETLGNLEANSSDDHLNLLIGKHFLGTDKPVASGTYQEAGGDLFKDGVSACDVDQGSVGTCYFLAALAGTANDKPTLINNMFTDNGDDTWTVRFETNGKTDYVTVDRDMATNGSGNYIYADDGDAGKQSVAGNNELWVALAEKAYAQVNESDRINQDGTNSYSGIGWGWMGPAMKHITGINYTSTWDGGSDIGISELELINIVNSDNVVMIGAFDSDATAGSTSDPTLVSTAYSGHAWSIVDYKYHAETDEMRFDIRDPYANNHLLLTYEQLLSMGGYIDYSNT